MTSHEGTAGQGRLGQDPPLTHWLLALSHESPFEKPQAGTSVRLPGAAPLLALLKDADPGARLRSVQGLGDLAEEARRTLPVVRAALEEAALHDEDEGVRTEAMNALLRAGPQPVNELGALTDALHSALGVVRCHAAIALGELGPAAGPALPILIHVSLWDEELAVQVAAAMALWKIDRKGPLAVHVLVRALGKDNELISWIAAECLGEMGPAAREAVPALRRALCRDFRLSIVKKGIRLALERIEPRGG